MEIDELERRASICAKDYDGIIAYHEAFFIHSIIYSAARCLDSFARYDHYKNQDIPPDDLISIVQEAVGHAAALSRYFWPSPLGKKKQLNMKQMKEKRGWKLRNAFKLDETSALYDRDLRNAWEHFDERLDEYLLKNDAGYFFPSCTIGSHTLADDPIGHIFKLLDKESNCLVLLSKKFFFIPIKEAVSDILSKAQQFDQSGSMLNI